MKGRKKGNAQWRGKVRDYFFRHFYRILKLFTAPSRRSVPPIPSAGEKSRERRRTLQRKAELLHDLAVRFAVVYLKNNSAATRRILDNATDLLVALSDEALFPPSLQRKLLLEAEKAAAELKDEFFYFLMQNPSAIWPENHPLINSFYQMNVSSKEQFKIFLSLAEKFPVKLYVRQLPPKSFAVANALHLLAAEILPQISKRVDQIPPQYEGKIAPPVTVQDL